MHLRQNEFLIRKHSKMFKRFFCKKVFEWHLHSFFWRKAAHCFYRWTNVSYFLFTNIKNPNNIIAIFCNKSIITLGFFKFGLCCTVFCNIFFYCKITYNIAKIILNWRNYSFFVIFATIFFSINKFSVPNTSRFYRFPKFFIRIFRSFTRLQNPWCLSQNFLQIVTCCYFKCRICIFYVSINIGKHYYIRTLVYCCKIFVESNILFFNFIGIAAFVCYIVNYKNIFFCSCLNVLMR